MQLLQQYVQAFNCLVAFAAPAGAAQGGLLRH
jgi:hypothetical protein